MNDLELNQTLQALLKNLVDNFGYIPPYNIKNAEEITEDFSYSEILEIVKMIH